MTQKKQSAKKAATKKVAAKKSSPTTQKKDDPPIRLVHTGKCLTLSGRSTLTFHVGEMDDDTYLRVYSNTGAGMHSRTWIAVDTLLDTLEKQPQGSTLTSYILHDLFLGRSSNDPSFTWAVLLHLKLIQPAKEKKRQYCYDSPDAFLAQIDKFKAKK